MGDTGEPGQDFLPWTIINQTVLQGKRGPPGPKGDSGSYGRPGLPGVKGPQVNIYIYIYFFNINKNLIILSYLKFFFSIIKNFPIFFLTISLIFNY